MAVFKIYLAFFQTPSMSSFTNLQVSPREITESMQGLATQDAATAVDPNLDEIKPKISDAKEWSDAERIGGPISMELAQNSSANNSGKGSRSSGLHVSKQGMLHNRKSVVKYVMGKTFSFFMTVS